MIFPHCLFFFFLKNHDEKGMKWPFEVAPFKVSVVTVGKEESVHQEGERITRLLMTLPELGDSVV